MTMDVRKTEASSSVPRLEKGDFFAWLEGIKQEFKKINWTTKEELKTYTKIVAGATFVIGLGIYVVDLLIQGTLSGLGALVRALIG